MQLTVYFDGQFWLGVCEHECDGRVLVARHVFGSEPADEEVYAFVIHELPNLLDASEGIAIEGSDSAATLPAVNPKRRARQAAADVRAHGLTTRSQVAVQQELEARKQERQLVDRAAREAEQERRRMLARQRAKARHRGH